MISYSRSVARNCCCAKQSPVNSAEEKKAQEIFSKGRHDMKIHFFLWGRNDDDGGYTGAGFSYRRVVRE